MAQTETAQTIMLGVSAKVGEMLAYVNGSNGDRTDDDVRSVSKCRCFQSREPYDNAACIKESFVLMPINSSIITRINTIEQSHQNREE